MSRQLELTVQGTVGTTPTLTRTPAGRAFCHMRVATTPSYRTDDGWRDGETVWFTAKAWGQLAENLCHSLHKGDPVLLVGRFTQETWADERGEHLTNVVTVVAGGHDLTRGETRFTKVAPASAPSPERAESGASAPSPGAAGEGLPQDHWERAESEAAADAAEDAAGGGSDEQADGTASGLEYEVVEDLVEASA